MSKKSTNENGEKLDKLENLLIKFISQSVPGGQTPSVAINNPPSAINAEDHNLLLRIDTKVERVISDVAELRNNFSNRVDALEREKENQRDALERHAKQETINLDKELRLRRLEQWGWMAIGGLAIIQVILKFFVK